MIEEIAKSAWEKRAHHNSAKAEWEKLYDWDKVNIGRDAEAILKEFFDLLPGDILENIAIYCQVSGYQDILEIIASEE